MDDALAIALGGEDEPATESGDDDRELELDAVSELRSALDGDDDEALLDALESVVMLLKRRK